MPRAIGKDIAEIFGHSPDDLSQEARSLWTIKACPFVEGPCIKTNHDKSIVYGVCSVKNTNGDEIITCPNRLYADNYNIIRQVSNDAFVNIPFRLYKEYIRKRNDKGPVVVALGHKSGREIGLGGLSIDWVLALIEGRHLLDYAGLEIQSMDITGNYRKNWEAYRNLEKNIKKRIPGSEHGINWANVHKRLIPQLIRKGAIFSKSNICTKGLHFALPELVYQRFEDVVGELATHDNLANNILSVHTYALGENVSQGNIRPLKPLRLERFTLEDFADGFIKGPNLPSGNDLDNAIRKVLGIQE